MREIKFRAWDKDENRYIIDGKDGYLANLLCCDDWDMVDPNDYVWEQFTGLKDVNGKDIYEGDIIVSKPNEPKYESPKIGVVKRSKVSAGWCCGTATDEYNIWTSGKYRTYEVIGNVHNPELLVENHD